MQPHPRPHRPRPTPRAELPSTGGPTDERASAPDVPPARPTGIPQPIRVPSLLATLRRSSAGAAAGSTVGVARGASVGAIAIGAALFVVATLASPVVAENASGKKPVPATSRTQHSVVAPTTSAASTPAAPPVAAAVTQSPAAAPADPNAISKLAGNGIPKVALNAYRVAAARVNHSDTGCRIHWSLLAGIGRAESDHGRFAGSQLRSDGTSTPPIVGPALTGRTWEYFPASPEYVRVTGDNKYAHALGPMQFIPSTWQGYGADANGDGKADIFNINDAALAAARYLCTAGGDLATQAGRVKAVLAYNHNDRYLAQVLALADAYKRGVPVSGIPVGDVTGSLPKVGHTGALPPVNPGAPTATGKDDKTPTTKPGRTKVPAKPGSGTKSGGTSGTKSGGTSGGKSGGTSGGGSGDSSGGTSDGSSGGSSGGTSGGAGAGSGGSGSGSGSGSADPTPTPSPSPTCNVVDIGQVCI